jgi:hypothetical protein
VASLPTPQPRDGTVIAAAHSLNDADSVLVRIIDDGPD